MSDPSRTQQHKRLRRSYLGAVALHAGWTLVRRFDEAWASGGIAGAAWRADTVEPGAHLDSDPANNRLRNLRALCKRSNMLHDRPQHLAQ